MVKFFAFVAWIVVLFTRQGRGNAKMISDRSIAYFSMEIALESSIPTYSGGLGVLAGDTIRAAADMKLPVVAVTLLHRKGYFSQTLDSDGTQHEEPTS